MIRQAIAWIVTLTFVVGPTALVFAQGTQAAPAQAPATSPAAPAAKKVATKSATGTVKSTTADSLMLVTKGKDKKTKEWTFVLDNDTKITKAGKPAEAKDLAEKDMATVTYPKPRGRSSETHGGGRRRPSGTQRWARGTARGQHTAVPSSLR